MELPPTITDTLNHAYPDFNWIAKDENGDVWLFVEKPTLESLFIKTDVISDLYGCHLYSWETPIVPGASIFERDTLEIDELIDIPDKVRRTIVKLLEGVSCRDSLARIGTLMHQ